MKPFLKWAGGKTWLVNSYHQYAPQSYKVYREPFLGGGAIFFNEQPQEFILSDLNADLIACYAGILEDPNKFGSILKRHQSSHCKDYYYKVRSSKPREICSRAARFVYLNRTCYNGLYRVNLEGKFNVPKGTSDVAIYEKDDFFAISRALQNGKLEHCDFEKTLDDAGRGDFVFVDPPYTVKHNNNGFIQYNERIFSWNDQIRLRDAIYRAHKRGVMVTVTNANHSSIIDLYDDFGSVVETSRSSLISGKSKSRGQVTEILVRIGWEPVTTDLFAEKGEVLSELS